MAQSSVVADHGLSFSTFLPSLKLVRKLKMKGSWTQTKGVVKEQWGKLTDDDLDVIEAVCSSTSMKVMVDCNQGWRMPWDVAQPWDIERVWPFAERLAELGVFWIEEPLERGEEEVRLRRIEQP